MSADFGWATKYNQVVAETSGTPRVDPLTIAVPMPILTPRLSIRPPEPGDGRALYEAKEESLPELRPWLPWTRVELGVEAAETGCREAQARFLKREDLRLFLFDRASGQLVGGSGLHGIDWEHRIFEIGYWIRTSRARKGLAAEAVNGLTRYAFAALAARRVSIHCNPENARSRGIPERLGFVLEGVLRNADRYSAPEIVCRDGAVFARTTADGLPPLEVAW